MNAVGFINNFILAHEALKDKSLSNEKKAEIALNLSLKLEEVELRNREMSLNEERARQEFELRALEARNKYESANAELVKSLVQAQAMIKSVWDNANINKCNALVGLFNSVMNAQNTNKIPNWREMFEEIKTAIYAIGKDSDNRGNRNDMVNQFKPILNSITQGMNNLKFINESLRQVAIIAPKLEICENEGVILRGVTLYNSSGYFLIDGRRIEGDTYLFKGEELGRKVVEYICTNEKGEEIKDSITLNVIPAKIDLEGI